MSWLKARDWATGVEYSSLFHSGLRAISLRPRARSTRSNSSRSSSREKVWSDGASSIVSLSPRLMRRRKMRTRLPSPSISVSTDPSPPPVAPSHKRLRSRPFVRPMKEMSDAWSSGGSFIEIEESLPKRVDEDNYHVGYLMLPIEMDTIRSIGGSQSLLVNLGEMDAAAIPPTGESFLSMSNSSDVYLHHPVPRRAYPVSLLTMSVSSRSSSLHYPRWERGDRAWMLEDSSPELKAYEFGYDGDVELEEERDAEDWRQFHVDWLRNIR